MLPEGVRAVSEGVRHRRKVLLLRHPVARRRVPEDVLRHSDRPIQPRAARWKRFTAVGGTGRRPPASRASRSHASAVPGGFTTLLCLTLLAWALTTIAWSRIASQGVRHASAGRSPANRQSTSHPRRAPCSARVRRTSTSASRGLSISGTARASRIGSSRSTGFSRAQPIRIAYRNSAANRPRLDDSVAGASFRDENHLDKSSAVNEPMPLPANSAAKIRQYCRRLLV